MSCMFDLVYNMSTVLWRWSTWRAAMRTSKGLTCVVIISGETNLLSPDFHHITLMRVLWGKKLI